jgi:outer membrane protein assembly factor BamD
MHAAATRPAGAGAAARFALRAWLLALALALTGCGLLPEVRDETATWSAERLYQAAHDAMLEGNYTRAIRLFETLEARFPYGRYAQQAILESAYANYRAGETAAAVAAAERFIRTYPNHPSVDYAYYLKGLVHFREDQGLLGYVYELDSRSASRRPCASRTRRSASSSPNSGQRYAEDSRARMKYPSTRSRRTTSGRAVLFQPRRVRRRFQPRAGGHQLPADGGEREALC